MVCGKDPSFNITGSITCAIWMKARTPEARILGEDWKSLLTIGSWWLGSYLDKNRTEFGRAFAKGEQSFIWIWTQDSVNVEKWHHLVGVHDGSKVCLYVDGILVDFETRGGNTGVSYGPVYVGGEEPHSTCCWNGLIDDVRIYSYALSAEEVKMLYEGKEPPLKKGL